MGATRGELSQQCEDVGAVDHALPVVAETERMIVGHRSARGLTGDEGNAAFFDERA